MIKKVVLAFFLLSFTTLFSVSFAQEEFDQEFSLEFEDDSDFDEDFDSEDLDSEDFDFQESFSQGDDGFMPTDEIEKIEPVRQRSRFTENEPNDSKDGKYIYHPNQEKGLYKINKNEEYLYKYERSKINGFFHLKIGSYNFKNFETNADVPANTTRPRFVDFYDTNTPLTFLLEYDWPLFKKLQSLSLSFSGGFSYNRGSGRFTDANVTSPVQERYTFWFLPVGVGLTYKFKFINNQIFLPYVNGTLNYNLLLEYREGFDAFEYLGVFGAHVAGGIAINLGWFERLTALQLDQDFGINNVYLTLEGRQVLSFENESDIGGFVFLGGLSFEY